MTFEELHASAKKAAANLTTVDAEQLRAELATFFAEIPEPPLYRRREEPQRESAKQLLVRGEALLAKLIAAQAEWCVPYQRALELHLQVQVLIATGRVEDAEKPWLAAVASERKATEGARLWRHDRHVVPPVFHEGTRASRFDPRPEARFEAKLVCPACRKVATYSVPATHPLHALRCSLCVTEFSTYIGEVREVSVEQQGRHHRYSLRLTGLGGTSERLAFADASGAALAIAVGDWLAFLYRPRSELRAVLNLSSSRVLWLLSGGPCFVVSMAFGESSREVLVFRRWRDERLLRSAFGRAFVRAYYACGPFVARAIRRSAVATQFTRAALRLVAEVLA